MTTIIIGLGNPGEKYKNTRHNIGFMVLDSFAENNNFPDFKLSKKYSAEISERNFGEETVLLAKPQTFMNESGKTARNLVMSDITKFLVIIHDDIDLPLGKIKIVKDRGSAGHKGVESIIKFIGNENLIRIRIGIDKSDVLKNFSVKEQPIVNESINKATLAINSIIKNGLEKTMNEFN